MRRLVAFVRGLGAAVLVVLVLFGAGAIRAAGATQRDDRIVALAYDPGTDTLLKAYPRALFRSTDGGQSWNPAAIPSPGNGPIAGVATSPAGKSITYVVGEGLGVLQTDDGGNSWIERNEGLPSRDVIAIAAHATQPETVYIVVRDHGVYRSQDAGKNWRLMDRSSQGDIRQLIHSNMAGSMQTGWLFAATSKGVRRSMDCFCLWQDAGKLESEAYSVTYDPARPEHIYAATEKGVFRSRDGGENWVQATSPGPKLVALVFARTGILYAAGEDGTLFRSTDQGNTWNPVNA